MLPLSKKRVNSDAVLDELAQHRIQWDYNGRHLIMYGFVMRVIQSLGLEDRIFVIDHDVWRKVLFEGKFTTGNNLMDCLYERGHLFFDEKILPLNVLHEVWHWYSCKEANRSYANYGTCLNTEHEEYHEGVDPAFNGFCNDLETTACYWDITFVHMCPYFKPYQIEARERYLNTHRDEMSTEEILSVESSLTNLLGGKGFGF